MPVMCHGRVTYRFSTLPPGHRGAEQLSSTKTSCQPTAQKWSQHTEGWKIIANSSPRMLSFPLVSVKQQKNQLTQWGQVELIVPPILPFLSVPSTPYCKSRVICLISILVPNLEWSVLETLWLCFLFINLSEIWGQGHDTFLLPFHGVWCWANTQK